MKARLSVLALVGLALSGACGSGDSDRSASDGTSSRPTVTQVRTGAGGAGSPAAGSAASPADQAGERAPGQVTSTTSSEEAPAGAPDSPGIVEAIEPSCVVRPGSVRVTIQTEPFADVSHAASFADGDSYGQWGVGVADADGRYVWNVVVGAQVPVGKASVVAAAIKGDAGGPGGGEFQVAGPGGCP